ncbi:hypothetical protein NP233_g11362 [Leucocoprinus birnbaumii]|uniref:Uncharacterized protein n=1 Tax=Leucocoprinus birnbaumii TaxID=56174 RepID=A0AAD5YR16_9AGAR|nr:hypothetical protein NP233_g11362 [Leucocoprinus birnbaumii]
MKFNVAAISCPSRFRDPNSQSAVPVTETAAVDRAKAGEVNEAEWGRHGHGGYGHGYWRRDDEEADWGRYGSWP